MKIGMSLSSTSTTLGARAAADHLLARVRGARDADLDTITFGDSHTRGAARYFQNTPTLGRALAEWDPDRAAGCLFLVPMWPPVLIAEHIGTLAAFHRGRFVVQTGLGGGPDSFAAFGAPVRHRGRALEEAMRIVDALCRGETVSSDMFGVVDAAVDLVPPDGFDWWMGTMSDAGLERAGRLGAAWYASHQATPGIIEPLLERYRSAFRPGSLAQPYVAVRRDAVVLEDGERAREIAAAALARGYRGMNDEMVVSGTAAEIAERLAPLSDVGVDEVMFRTIGVDPAVDLETIEQLGVARRLLAD